MRNTVTEMTEGRQYHPSPSRLELYILAPRRVPGEEFRAIEAHLCVCPECSDRALRLTGLYRRMEIILASGPSASDRRLTRRFTAPEKSAGIRQGRRRDPAG